MNDEMLIVLDSEVLLHLRLRGASFGSGKNRRSRENLRTRVPEITCQYRLFALLGAMYNMGYSSLKAGPKSSSTNNCEVQLQPGNELLEAYSELGELAVVIDHIIQLFQLVRS
jgi:hypothetical protein